MDRGRCLGGEENDGGWSTQPYRRRIHVDVGAAGAMMKVDSERHREKRNEKARCYVSQVDK